MRRLSQLLKKVPVAEQESILATCTLGKSQNRPIQSPSMPSVLSGDQEEEELITPLVRKRKAMAQGGEGSEKKVAAAIPNVQSETEQNPRSAATQSVSPSLSKITRVDLSEERGADKRTTAEKVERDQLAIEKEAEEKLEDERDRKGKKAKSEGAKTGKSATQKMAKRKKRLKS